MFVVPEAMWNVATAITPSGTTTVFEPRLIIKQLVWSDRLLHDDTSPAPVANEVAATLTELKSVEE